MVADGWDRARLIEESLPVIASEYGLTLRALHYKLVAKGMPNTINNYKRLGAAMTAARWDGQVDFSSFSDHERSTHGYTYYEDTDVDSAVDSAIGTIETELEVYMKNRWERQPEYVEVWVEKKALQGQFLRVTRRNDVLLFPCRGYPSLTWLDAAADRFNEARDAGMDPVLIYFGDYDCSGEDIPRSIEDNLAQMGCDVEVDRILLLENQVLEMGLPPAPTKRSDTRSVRWHGIGQVELDAVDSAILRDYIQEGIDKHFDYDIYAEIQKEQEQEEEEYCKLMKEKIIELVDNLETDDDDDDEED